MFSRLMAARPDLRIPVIIGLANYALTITDDKYTLIYNVLYKVNFLFFYFNYLLCFFDISL